MTINLFLLWSVLDLEIHRSLWTWMLLHRIQNLELARSWIWWEFIEPGFCVEGDCGICICVGTIYTICGMLGWRGVHQKKFHFVFLLFFTFRSLFFICFCSCVFLMRISLLALFRFHYRFRRSRCFFHVCLFRSALSQPFLSIFFFLWLCPPRFNVIFNRPFVSFLFLLPLLYVGVHAPSLAFLLFISRMFAGLFLCL